MTLDQAKRELLDEVPIGRRPEALRKLEGVIRRALHEAWAVDVEALLTATSSGMIDENVAARYPDEAERFRAVGVSCDGRVKRR